MTKKATVQEVSCLPFPALSVLTAPSYTLPKRNVILPLQASYLHQLQGREASSFMRHRPCSVCWGQGAHKSHLHFHISSGWKWGTSETMAPCAGEQTTQDHTQDQEVSWATALPIIVLSSTPFSLLSVQVCAAPVCVRECVCNNVIVTVCDRVWAWLCVRLCECVCAMCETMSECVRDFGGLNIGVSSNSSVEGLKPTRMILGCRPFGR